MLEKALISAVVHQRQETVYRARGATPARLFAALAEANVNVDTILQERMDEVVFSAPPEDRDAAVGALDALGATWEARDDLGKVSVIGAGMKSHPGVAARTFATLERPESLRWSCRPRRSRSRATSRRPRSRPPSACSTRHSSLAERTANRRRRRHGRGRYGHARAPA